MILHNANIFTVNTRQPHAQAVDYTDDATRSQPLPQAVCLPT